MDTLHKKPTTIRRITRKPLWDKDTCKAALKKALLMLRPDLQWKNPVMFVVEIGTLLLFIEILFSLFGYKTTYLPLRYCITLDIWLFLTVLFANFATALAEERGKAQAESLKKTRRDIMASLLDAQGKTHEVSSSSLNRGDRVVVQAGQLIPADGEIIEGVASIDESAITGESAPVLREADSDRSSVTAGTMVLSDRIVVLVTSSKGESFLDHMIALIEGAIRQRTPNELALTMLLSAFSLIFLIVVVPLLPMALYSEQYMRVYLNGSERLHNLATDIPTLIALVVCLIPTTIGALLSAIGIAGMDRALQSNIISNSGKVIELAGDIDVVLLDKTGTITLGNRRATRFLPTDNYSEEALMRLAAIASIADNTPEGKSIKRFYEEKVGAELVLPPDAVFIPFTARSRMSGIDLPDGRKIRKGAPDAIIKYITNKKGSIPSSLHDAIEVVASQGATPLVIAEDENIAGVICLEDILKPHMKERLQRLRNMGLSTIMITGDNPQTAKAIVEQAGIDEFLAEATPEKKLAFIQKLQAEGKLVAMMGDGTNDAPALAQADVALAMNAGTEAAKEAANLVDLDSDPSKLIEVVENGKQLLITRGALTTFSIGNDVAKYFAIIPALFAGTLPWLTAVDIMHLHSPTSAILSAVVFNALIIPLLIPIALKGIRYKAIGADSLLRKNLFLWGFGGVLLPFAGIKIIDLVMVSFGWVK